MSTPTSAELVATIRARRDLTQEELARELGVSFTTVNAWERGRSEPRRAKRLQLEEMAAAVQARDALRILAVDDDPISLAVVEGLVAATGVKVDVATAEDGVTGLLRCGQFAPDLLFLDLLMPGLDGIAVAQRVAAMDDLDVEVVFMTSSTDRQLLRRARSAEPAALLQKPLEADEVRALVTDAAERAGLVSS